ncbi:hypothetical protein COCCADRAFT_32727 [Bipolaris zeicola 26-R-13]|uniref:Uncharacterized protein n=1 Tax=Cochliobolus carbonum (strain 26-R-13) TaxID=930089 RepID=W6YS99_COCC2|nr:uncharacterized protein COCCADRAFT_32727 [Bipolaris zeicola 26-R-13]EUC38274.1 hypothetical protein COCCADRAFT_32727 [Bipolaris zeicola 26-R-13]
MCGLSPTEFASLAFTLWLLFLFLFLVHLSFIFLAVSLFFSSGTEGRSCRLVYGAAREFPFIGNVIQVRARYSYEREASAKLGRLRRGLEQRTSRPTIAQKVKTL